MILTKFIVKIYFKSINKLQYMFKAEMDTRMHRNFQNEIYFDYEE